MKTIHLVVGIVLTLMCILFMGFREIGRYPDKIWLHRCNSMEKLYEKEKRKNVVGYKESDS